ALRPGPLVASQRTPDIAAALPPALFAAGQRVPPTASLAVTVQRHLPTLRAQTTHVDMNALARVRNAEMLVAAAARTDTGRSERRAIGRLMIASAVAMRSLAQEPVWFPTDTAIDAALTAAGLGIADIAFDRAGSERHAASLRHTRENLSQPPTVGRSITERPAEIFATRVDWFVAQALARQGISDGFLSAVQDELLTGHVVHPERLQGSARSRSLLTALVEMTSVSEFVREEYETSVLTLLRWSLAVP